MRRIMAGITDFKVLFDHAKFAYVREKSKRTFIQCIRLKPYTEVTYMVEYGFPDKIGNPEWILTGVRYTEKEFMIEKIKGNISDKINLKCDGDICWEE